MNVIGIDPGKNGAIALIDSERKRIRLETFTNLTLRELHELITRFAIDDCQAFVELTGVLPHDGKVSAASFGEQRGYIKAFLTACRVPFQMVSPPVWQRAFGMGKKYPTSYARKTAHLQKAQELFPAIKVTRSDADALLIAEYGYRTS